MKLLWGSPTKAKPVTVEGVQFREYTVRWADSHGVSYPSPYPRWKSADDRLVVSRRVDKEEWFAHVDGRQVSKSMRSRDGAMKRAVEASRGKQGLKGHEPELVERNGEKRTLAEWAKVLGVSRPTMYRHYSQGTWPRDRWG